MSATDQPSEEELRAAYEAEIKRIGVDQVLLEQVVTLINLGMRRTGLQPGTEDERDPAQVRTAIDAVRALLPLAEQAAGPQAGPIREALSQMQLAYVRMGEAEAVSGVTGATDPDAPADAAAGTAPESQPGPGATPPGGAAPPTPGSEPGSEGPGPAQRSGRLWVPGQP